MESPVQILLAEDDYHYGGVIKKHLEAAGYSVVHCYDGEVAWRKFQRSDFDLVLLDVVMPKKDGFTLAQDIRKKNGMIPILFLTSRAMDEDRLEGFRIGGDDYIIKPFSMRELLLRIRVFLKRSLPKNPPGGNVYRLGQLFFNYVEKELTNEQGNLIGALTKREALLLRHLVENCNKLVKREELLLKIWGTSSFFASRSMDVFITRLRKHFKQEPGIELETLHNVGIRLNIPESSGS